MPATLAIQPQEKHDFKLIEPSNSQLQEMERVQKMMDPYLEEMNAPKAPSQLVDPKLAKEALDTVNEIRVFCGEEPITDASVTRRLLALLNRIASVVEDHLYFKKEKNHKEETEIKEGTLQNIKSWVRWQGGFYACAGFGTPLLLLAGALIGNEGINEALKSAAGLTSTGAQAADRLIESWKMDEQYKKDMHLQTAQAKKQGEEGLKNLPLQLQQLLMKLNDQMNQMIRATGQRG